MADHPNDPTDSDDLAYLCKHVYYFEKGVTSLIRKTFNAPTVMLAVLKIIQNTVNAVTVMLVKMYQTISKHIMFR